MIHSSRRHLALRVGQVDPQPARRRRLLLQSEADRERVPSRPCPGVGRSRLHVGPIPLRLGNADHEQRIVAELRVVGRRQGEFRRLAVGRADLPQEPGSAPPRHIGKQVASDNTANNNDELVSVRGIFFSPTRGWGGEAGRKRELSRPRDLARDLGISYHTHTLVKTGRLAGLYQSFFASTGRPSRRFDSRRCVSRSIE